MVQVATPGLQPAVMGRGAVPPKPKNPGKPSPTPLRGVGVTLACLPDILVFAAAALLPWLGRGMAMDGPALPEVPLGQLALALLLGAAVLIRPSVKRHDVAGRWLAALALIGLLSLLPRRGPMVVAPGGAPFATAFPSDPDGGLADLARLGLLALAALAAARARRGWLLGGLTAGGLAVAISGVREYLASWRGGDPSWRIFAGFVGPNQLAAYLVLVLPLAAAATALGDDSAPGRWLASQGVARPRRWLALLGSGAALLMLAALALTGSKGAMLATALGVGLAALALARGGARRAALGVLAALALLAAAALLGPLRARLVHLVGQANSSSFRVLTWAGTLDLARHHPLLGCGLGGWALGYPIYARAEFTQHAHSSFLQILAECGVGGLLAFAGLFAAGARAAWRQVAASPAVGAAAVVAITAFAVANLVDFGWGATAGAAGLVMLCASLGPEIELRPARRWPLALLTAAVLAPLTLMSGSEQLRAAGQAALQSGERGSAEAAFAAARAWDPLSALASEDLAGVLAARDDRAGATAAYRRAAALRPTSARIHYRLAAVEARWGQLDEALGESALATALSPMHLQNWLQLGQLREQDGQSEAAYEAYRELDRRACSPALRDAKPLSGYQLDITHATALVRLAALADARGEADLAADARRRAKPELEAYLETYDREAAMLKEASGADRTDSMLIKGLTAAERDKAAALLAEARGSN
jgi:O-antigen ligase